MPERLSEASWSAFAKAELSKEQRKLLDDAALLKALSVLDAAGEGQPALRAKALDALIQQIKKQVLVLAKLKMQLGDKPFNSTKDKLYGLLDAAETQYKQAAEDSKKAAAGGDDDDEAGSPALLSTAMLPLLRELRRGEARMHALICTAGKNTALLISRRAISASRRRLLADAVDATGGMKYIVAECLFDTEARMLVFEVRAPAAGLAKRLRAALLQQTEQRLKVKVRGQDGDDADGEDEPEDGGVPSADAGPEAQAQTAEQLAYARRLDKLRERLQLALAQQHPESAKLRALLAFAGEKAEGGQDYAAAGKALDMLDKLLSASPAASDAGAPPWLAASARLAPAVEAALKAGRGDVHALRLAWDFAQGKAAARDFASAMQSLGTVARLLQAAQAAKPQVISQDMVAKRSFLHTRWKQIPTDLRVQLGSLLKAIRADYPGEDVVALGKAIDAKLGQLISDAQARLDAAVDHDIIAGDRGYATTTAQLRALRAEVASNPMVVALRDNAFTAGAAFVSAFERALTEAEATLSA